jgi:chromosomal replication initiation ATPase DnaA
MNLPPAKLKRFLELSTRIQSLSKELSALLAEHSDLVQMSEDAQKEQSILKHSLKITADHYGVSISELMGRRRTARVAEARQVVFWLLIRACGMTGSEASRLTGRDHHTILHGVRRVEERRSVYRGVLEDTNTLRSLVYFAAIEGNEEPPTA